ISPDGAKGGSRSRRWLRPFSSTITDQPAAVRTSAAVAPPGPLPMTTASQSRSVTAGDLFIGVPARLHVAPEADPVPPPLVTVAAVLGCPVRAFARVPVQQLLELGHGVEARVLLVRREPDEVGSERGDAVPVLPLPAVHRSVELALGDAQRAFDAGSPGELLE